MNPIDKSHKAFEEYLQNLDVYKSKDLSESDTRSKLLDKLLIDVLGWSEQLIEREGYVRTGFLTTS